MRGIVLAVAGLLTASAFTAEPASARTSALARENT